MKKFLFTLAVFLLCINLFSSNAIRTKTAEDTSTSGVTFEDISLPEALEKAKKENKLILIDFYSPT